MKLSKFYVADNWNDVAVKPKLDLGSATQACHMFLNVACDKIVDGHLIASPARIAAIGNCGLGVER
jgi:hypothetical protein